MRFTGCFCLCEGVEGADGLALDDRDHYTCNICEKKGHWIQECPEKAERDAQRGPRGGAPKRPIQRSSCFCSYTSPHALTRYPPRSRRMLVLPLQSESDQTLDCVYRERDVPHLTERSTVPDEQRRADGTVTSAWWWPRFDHPGAVPPLSLKEAVLTFHFDSLRRLLTTRLSSPSRPTWLFLSSPKSNSTSPPCAIVMQRTAPACSRSKSVA